MWRLSSLRSKTMNMCRRITTAVVACTLCAFCLAETQAQSRLQTALEEHWEQGVLKELGTCNPTHAGTLIIAHGNVVTSIKLADQTVGWTTEAGFNVVQVSIVPDAQRSVILVTSTDWSQTSALDGSTGAHLWTMPGRVLTYTTDVYGRHYTDVIRYPYGAPNLGGGASPDVAVSMWGDSCSTSRLVDSRTGEIIWSRMDCDCPGCSGYPGRYASQFLPTPTGSYDVIFSSGPFFTGTGGELFRVDGATGANVVWSRQFSNRSGIPVPDLTGDGQYEFFAAPSYWSSMVFMLSGENGTDVWSTSYGSFDVIATPQVLPGEEGYDVIVSAQSASAGGIRRYRGSDGYIIWDCPHTYNYNTIMGLLKRTDGLTVLSGWVGRSRAIAIDAATGQVLWDDIPASDGGFVGIGIPDMTGDCNDDFLALNNGWFRLYDGVSGEEQTSFSPLEGEAAALDSDECDAPTASRDLSHPRMFYCDEWVKTIEITIDAPEGALAISAEDTPPPGWTDIVSISDGGSYDAIHHKVKWGPFFEPFPTLLSYEVDPPDGTSGEQCFGPGIVSIDGDNETVCGDECIDYSCCPYALADDVHDACEDCADCGGNCQDGQVQMGEVIGYACAWKRGCNDDISGMTRSAYIWRAGECYCWDDVEENWMSHACESPASGCCDGGGRALETMVLAPVSLDMQVEAVGSDEVSPVSRGPFAKPTVDAHLLQKRFTINATPPSGTLASAFEVQVPKGWTVSAIGNGGTRDDVHRKVKWGPLFGDASVTLSFEARAVLTASGSGRFTGTASFDGIDYGFVVR